MSIKFAKFTQQEIDILRRYYPKAGTHGVLKMYAIKGLPLRTPFAIKSAAQRYGVKTETGGRFQKGQMPANKGKQMQPEVKEKVKKTWFKPGNICINTLPVGTKVKGTDGYWKIKVAMPNKWQLHHRYIWQQHNGSIPPTHVIIFKDGNADNIVIENLLCIHRAQLAVKNSKAGLPKKSKSLKEAWSNRKRRLLREKYGSLSAAMAAGEKL